MPKFKVNFVHVEEIEYEGYVEADSYEEAMKKVEDEPFDIEELEDWNHQGLEIKDIELEEVED